MIKINDASPKWWGKFFGDKAFYKHVLKVALPIFLQMLVTSFVSLVDNIMVGRVGTEQMSGVSIANQLIFVFNLAIFGVTAGAGIFTSQYFGTKNYDKMKESGRFMIWFGAIIYLLGMFILILFDDQLISLFLHEGSVEGNIELTLASAKQYLHVILFGLLPFVIPQILTAIMRSANKTLFPMVAGACGVAVNCLFNYVLIFGKLGFPCLGVKGAAIATVLSRVVETLMLVSWAIFKKEPYFVGWLKTIIVPKNDAKIYFVKSLPMFLNEVCWALGMTALVQCYSTKGLDVVAAFNISNTLMNMFNASLMAMGAAIGIIIGNLLGADDIDGAKSASTKLTVFSLIISLVMACGMASISGVFPLIYKTTTVIKSLTTKLIIIASFTMPIQAICNAGYFTIRAGGKTFITFLFDSVFIWVVSVATAYVLTRFCDMDIIWIYIIVCCTEIIRATIGLVIMKMGIWCNNMTKPTAGK
ncbi:MAG: MATE family efflux transporter [Clostridia bacterium]|nr:MATE family efflux transporter [Clostridia bacterium]